MQVQKIANNNAQSNTNFNGKLFIEPDLSYYPCKFVRQHYNKMQNLIADKPFDLFIRQNHKQGTVNVIAQKEMDALNKNSHKHVVTMKKDLDCYDVAAESAIEGYEKTLASRPKSFKERLANLINKIF